MGKTRKAATEAQPLLRDLLRDVSRSFYLTLRILPKSIRDEIGLAYLLARATDTIADTEAVPLNERLAALGGLRDRIMGTRAGPFTCTALQENQSSHAEKILLERINEALQLLSELSTADRELIQQVLRIICSGQELDLVRFDRASAKEITALASEAELDDYTHRVAGCVGEFWTRMCLAHLSPKPKVPVEILVERGIRFGKGLQLVNILRDLPSDLRTGRCYIPWPALQLVGLRPADLLEPTNEPRLRPVYNEWLKVAEDHLDVAWKYVLDLPQSWWRVRLACAWPVLIGVKTLGHLKTQNVLNPDIRIKANRSEVKQILRQSVILYPFSAFWARLPDRVKLR